MIYVIIMKINIFVIKGRTKAISSIALFILFEGIRAWGFITLSFGFEVGAFRNITYCLISNSLAFRIQVIIAYIPIKNLGFLFKDCAACVWGQKFRGFSRFYYFDGSNST